jgi:FkbM family methyltransferase
VVARHAVDAVGTVNDLFDHFVATGDELRIMTRRAEFGPAETRETASVPLAYEAFEWKALFDAMSDADRRFTMFELGAGFGRWTVRAVAAIRLYRPGVKYRLVAVEAEPTHFRWLEQHTRDNRVRRWSRAGTCKLVNAAVSGDTGRQDFYVGDPASWYGQALVRPENVGADADVLSVKTITLSKLLDEHDFVDLIDVDIQGAELEVLTEAAPLLGRVRRIYVETHSAAIDSGLHRVFADAPGDWSPVVSIPLGARHETPLGYADFAAGGAQLWLNTVLA